MLLCENNLYGGINYWKLIIYIYVCVLDQKKYYDLSMKFLS